MRRIVLSAACRGGALALATLLSLSLPGPAALEEAVPPAATGSGSRATPEALKKDLVAVIEGQLAAFRAEDYAKAYTFAAGQIQDLFSVAEFEKMVKDGYPAVAHSKKADFGPAFDSGLEAIVEVRVENADHRPLRFQYLLKKEEGKWKIGGVLEMKPPGLEV